MYENDGSQSWSQWFEGNKSGYLNGTNGVIFNLTDTNFTYNGNKYYLYTAMSDGTELNGLVNPNGWAGKLSTAIPKSMLEDESNINEDTCPFEYVIVPDEATYTKATYKNSYSRLVKVS